MFPRVGLLLGCAAFVLAPSVPVRAAEADLILHNGKIVTVDKKLFQK
jgi:hypothetical protein